MGQPILSKFSSFPSTLSASVCWSIKALPHGGALVVPLVKSWRFLFRKRVGRTWSLKNQKHPLLSFQWCYGAGGGCSLLCFLSILPVSFSCRCPWPWLLQLQLPGPKGEDLVETAWSWTIRGWFEDNTNPFCDCSSFCPFTAAVILSLNESLGNF